MTTAKDSAPTALMRQYLDVKGRYQDALLFFRLGDFYEMFFEDAVYVARVLGLTLTSRDKGKEDPVPMCGVPHHSARGYITRLTELGHRVALCEQLEDPRLTKGIVKRDVVRVITPGVILDEESLDPRAPSFVAAVAGEPRTGFGLAFVDVTTGDFRATEAPSTEALLDELARAEPRELLLPKGDTDLGPIIRRAYPRLSLTPVSFDKEPDPQATLAKALGGGFDPQVLANAPMALRAAARVLSYIAATQRDAPLPISKLDLYARDEFLVIDEQARAHLELIETMQDRRQSGSLLAALDESTTAMGGRLLRRWLLFPLCQVTPIRRRQDAVERLVLGSEARAAVRKILGELADVERLAGRVKLGVATPRDVVALGKSLGRLPDLAAALAPAQAGVLDRAVDGEDDPLSLGTDLKADLAAHIAATLRDEAPALTKDGGFVRPGVSQELDDLVALVSGGRDRIVQIEARERERTGIPSLKVKYNNVFGYYIEITHAKLAGTLPAEYTRKQTVANAERFVTPELADYEAQIATAHDRQIALELRIFEGLRAEVSASAHQILALGGRVAAVDVLATLAEVAHRHSYVRPTLDDSTVLDLVECRHPVVERLTPGGFVPNDVRLDSDGDQLMLVTGPNMAGKSTLIRQVALSVIMGQMGGFVPARQARIGIVDRVFTRVGAGDNLARGESTFFVEMHETAHILRYATRKSLVVLDEIGRGTSTYDGVSIAWAVAEHLHDNVGARTLFATHYHELTALSETHPRVRNVSVAAREWNGEVVFLRTLTAGGVSRSFGIEVGKLAGLPPSVVSRAREILGGLEGRGPNPGGPRPMAPGHSPQLGLFEKPAESPELVRLRAVAAIVAAQDPDELSPRAAWDFLVAIQKKLEDPNGK